MAIIDLVRWAPQNNEIIYAWRYPETNLSTYTQLLVAESQEAVLFSKGQLMGKFGPGKHTLDTENLPILRSLFGIPFGGKNPFTAEIWFVNKVATFNIDWDATSITVHDADYNTMMPLRATGQYGLRLVDAEKFLIKLVGTRSQFTQRDMTAQFTGEFTSKTKSAIVKFMLQNRLGIKEILGYLDNLSDFLAQSMAPFWADLGLELSKFYVSSIEIDDTTPEGQSVKRAIAQQSSMSITGHTWQQEQMFGTANNAIAGFSEGQNGMLGTLLAINMMGGMGGGNGATTAGAGIAAGMMQPRYDQPTFAPGGAAVPPAPAPAQPHPNAAAPAANMIFCANCSRKFPSSSRFCPHCGHVYNPCPSCGSDNLDNARRCVSCGTVLTGAAPGADRCPACNTPVTPGAAFCPTCGSRLTTAPTCSRCGSQVAPGTKFCPCCGNKIN